MQRYCTELTEKLLKSLDKEYNVVDMGAVVDVITALEKTTITKEVLEITRLGKYINELRRKTNNDVLAKRAKDLVRRWRDMVLPSSHSTSHPISADNTSLYQILNGSTTPQSPTAKGLITQSTAITRVIKPQSPLLHDVLPSKVVSPSLTLNSEHTGSSNLTPVKQPAVYCYKSNSASSPRLIDSTNQNHPIEAVPRTHSSNKRLRKEDKLAQQSQYSSPLQHQQESQQRINGENVINLNPNSQVPSSSSSTMKERNLLDTSSSTEIDIVGPKKRGRKKGSKSLKNQLTPEDQVKEKLASISRNPKLKTTQELLADLQARGSNTGITNVINVGTHSLKRTKTEPPTTVEILRNINSQDVDNSTVNNTKFSMSNHYQSRVPDIEVIEVKNVPSTNLTVKEILAKLPPLDLESIRWSDDETDRQNHTIEVSVDHTISCQRQITDADVDRLHQMSIESVNGNFQLKLKQINEEESATGLTDLEAIETTAGISKQQVQDGTNKEFREWHEMLVKPTYDGQILHILPYVIID